MAKSTADLLVERLHDWGVDVVFGLPGDGIDDVMEALRTHQDDVRFIQVRHEESAAFAACGYAKYTGRLGVCLATSGPGGLHLLNGLADAQCDQQPVLAITGHTFHDLIGTHYQQDVDLDKIFLDVAEYNERVMGPAHVVNVVDQAVKTSLGRRAVSHITLPKDVQGWTTDDAMRSAANVPRHSADLFAPAYGMPPQELLQEAADVINAGSKVAIMAGRGALNCRDEVLALAKLVAGPVVKPLLGKAVVPDDDPSTTGGIGLLGTAPSQDALQECDTLVILGSSFPYIEFYPKPGQAKAVQIDVSSVRIGLRYPVDVGLLGDCKGVLGALLPLIHRKEDQSFLHTAQERMTDWRTLLEARGTRQDLPMKPQVVTRTLNKLLAADAIVSTDSGTNTTWAARYLDMRDGMQFSVSGSLASMACGLPYSLGAAVAYPDRQIVAVVGDGGFTMLMGEVATLVKYGLPVKIVIIKNNAYGEIKWEQMVLNANPAFGVELQPIDFAAYAKACGAAGFTIERPDECEAVLREALATPGPAVVQAAVDPNEPPMPGKLTTEQAKNLTAALLKGDRDRVEIVKTIAEDFIKNRVREVV
ncbi:MAG TPA: thiamine pyrophosphate-dependent enzyme [Thermomicrobiales bacterium]|nr:thiamine pyrophosphate-dependent enzyme [Thermomicrobiales bacterium]